MERRIFGVLVAGAWLAAALLSAGQGRGRDQLAVIVWVFVTFAVVFVAQQDWVAAAVAVALVSICSAARGWS